MLIDTHGHPQFRGYGDKTPEMMARSIEKDVVVNIVGTEKGTSTDAVKMAENYSNCFATIGLHPGHLFSEHHDENESSSKIDEKDFDYQFYEKLSQNKKVVAIGECGLDLYRLPEGISRKVVLEKQIEIFLKQASLAKKQDLPLVIHCRDAHAEMIKVLSGLPNQTGTIHCFTADQEIAEQYLSLGYFLGFTGIITFPPQKKDPDAQNKLWDVVKSIPLDKFLVETDCPYLAPLPYRGKQGEPWMVDEVVKKIAELRGVKYEEILEASVNNAKNLFKSMVLS